ncbi:MAG: imidazole glycerol phosphate synthase subunit HisH [Tepidisphaerales bacterium]
MITILDYDMANLRSVQKAIEHVGGVARIVREPEEVDRAEKLILPGVGAFGDCVRVLRERQLDQAVLRFIRSGRPLLGICVGMQVLFARGHEDGLHAGLGVFDGDVVRFEVDRTHGLKIPHMGWNTLEPTGNRWAERLLRDVAPGSHVYFVHSYHCVAADPTLAATTTEHGIRFISSIARENVMATQFHPEKSQAVGLKMLANFAAL